MAGENFIFSKMGMLRKAAARSVTVPSEAELRETAELLKSFPTKNEAEGAFRDKLVQRISTLLGEEQLAATKAGVSAAPADAVRNSISNLMNMGRQKGAYEAKGLGEGYPGQLEQGRADLRQTMGESGALGFSAGGGGGRRIPKQLHPERNRPREGLAQGFDPDNPTGSRFDREISKGKFQGDLERHRMAKAAIDRRMGQIGDELIFLDDQLKSGRIPKEEVNAQRAKLMEETNALAKQRLEMKRKQAQTGTADPDDYEGTETVDPPERLTWGREGPPPLRDYRTKIPGMGVPESVKRFGRAVGNTVSQSIGPQNVHDVKELQQWATGGAPPPRKREEFPVNQMLELMQYLPDQLPVTGAIKGYEALEKAYPPRQTRYEGGRIRLQDRNPRKRGAMSQEAWGG